MVAWLMVLSLAMASLASADLHGAWVLVAVHHGDSINRDPRVSATLGLDAGGAFDLRGDTVQEIRMSGPGGETTRARHTLVHLAGRYKLVGRQLLLAPSSPPAGEDLAFARQNFGEPDAQGRFAPTVSLSGHLFLAYPGREQGLEFGRRERR